MFDSIVHENQQHKAVVKFGYLKSYLERESLKLESNLMLTGGNYELFLVQLTSRYSNHRIIAERHFDELSSAPIFGDGTSIRNLLNIVTESTSALVNISYPVDQ